MAKKTAFLSKVQYWLTLAFLHSLRVFTWLPYSLQLKLGRHLGRILLKKSGKMRKVASTNLELCFPELSQQQRDALLVKNFEELGMGFFETLFAAWGSISRLRPLLHSVAGLEDVKTTLAEGKGVILLFPHLIPMYFVGQLLLNSANLPFALMYHSPKNRALSDFMLTKLQTCCAAVFNRRDIKKMIHYLQQGRLVWYAPDLDLGAKSSLFIPFFGLPAATLTTPRRLADLTGAKLFPIAFYRREQLDGFDVIIHPALNDFPSEDEVNDLTRINATLETIIRHQPEMYLWQYRRFSTRPEGEKKVY